MTGVIAGQESWCGGEKLTGGAVAGVAQVTGGQLLDDAAIGEDGDPVRHPGGHAEVVGDEDDGEPGVAAHPGDEVQTWC